MPNIKSAKKRVLVSKLRNARNKAQKTALKTVLKKAHAATAGKEEFAAAVVGLDKAAGRGLIHKNKAARLKSRLAKAQNKA
jgi:small subunit ribosomal protein S20